MGCDSGGQFPQLYWLKGDKTIHVEPALSMCVCMSGPDVSMGQPSCVDCGSTVGHPRIGRVGAREEAYSCSDPKKDKVGESGLSLSGLAGAGDGQGWCLVTAFVLSQRA